MKLIKTFILILFAAVSFAQSNADKVSNLKFYLSQLRDNVYYARQFADSTKMIMFLDSLEAQIERANAYSETIVIVEDTSSVQFSQDIYTNDEENTDSGDRTKKGDYDMQDSNPLIDKFNPLSKSKTKFIIETGINNFIVNDNGGTEAKVNTGGSWYWNFTLMKQIYLSKGLDLNFGISFQRNRFRFSNDVALTNVNDQISYFQTVPLAKSDPKLIVEYLNIPVLFKIKCSRAVNINLGGFGGYRIGSRQKIETKQGNVEVEEIRRSPYGLNDWNYGVKAGVSINKFHLMCQYHLSNLFDKQSGYDYHTFMLGTMFKI